MYVRVVFAHTITVCLFVRPVCLCTHMQQNFYHSLHKHHSLTKPPNRDTTIRKPLPVIHNTTPYSTTTVPHFTTYNSKPLSLSPQPVIHNPIPCSTVYNSTLFAQPVIHNSIPYSTTTAPYFYNPHTYIFHNHCPLFHNL